MSSKVFAIFLIFLVAGSNAAKLRSSSKAKTFDRIDATDAVQLLYKMHIELDNKLAALEHNAKYFGGQCDDDLTRFSEQKKSLEERLAAAQAASDAKQHSGEELVAQLAQLHDATSRTKDDCEGSITQLQNDIRDTGSDFAVMEQIKQAVEEYFNSRSKSSFAQLRTKVNAMSNAKTMLGSTVAMTAPVLLSLATQYGNFDGEQLLNLLKEFYDKLSEKLNNQQTLLASKFTECQAAFEQATSDGDNLENTLSQIRSSVSQNMDTIVQLSTEYTTVLHEADEVSGRCAEGKRSSDEQADELRSVLLICGKVADYVKQLYHDHGRVCEVSDLSPWHCVNDSNFEVALRKVNNNADRCPELRVESQVPCEDEAEAHKMIEDAVQADNAAKDAEDAVDDLAN